MSDGIIQQVFKKEIAKHQKNLRDYGYDKWVSEKIQMLERLRDELIQKVKENADYDGDVYTKTLIGQYFTKGDL